MGTIWVKEFTGGLDTRRLPETTPGGVLIRATDGHINRGGEFEQRAAFVPAYNLPAGTVGLAHVPTGLVVFGHQASVAGLPSGVTYQRLTHPDGVTALVRVPSYDLYAGKIYAVGVFADGSRHHFYDGARVGAWYDGRARASFAVTGGGLAPAVAATGSFEVTGGTLGAGNQITSVAIDGVTITNAAVLHTGNNGTTAAAVAANINAFASSPDYTAVADGQLVRITASTAGSAANGKTIVVTVGGTVTVAGTRLMAGGVDAVTSRLTALTVDGQPVISGTVNWTSSNEATAVAIANAINAYTSSPDYSATAVGDTVNVIAATPGAAANGRAVSATLADGLVITPASGLVLAGGGGDYVAGVAATSSFNVTGGTLGAGNQITAISVNGVTITSGPVAHTGSNSTTAAAIAANINAFTSSPEYTAAAVGATVTISAAVTDGASANGRTVAVTVGGDATATAPAAMTGGVTEVNVYLPGAFVQTIGSKVYSTSGALLHFSGIQQPTKWTTDTTGAGFIDMSSQSSGAEELVAVAKYQNGIVVFAEGLTQIFYVDPDPLLNKQLQEMDNTGTACPGSVTQYGDSDIFYLHESGLRSLRARYAANTAATEDIGVPVDDLITAQLREMSADDRERVTGLINPTDGRFWLIMRDRVYVFTYYKNAKVSAWTTYTLSTPETGTFVLDTALVYRRKVYLRAGDTVYVYGGLGAVPVYDDTPAQAWLPMFDAMKPTARKQWSGLDVAALGVWEIRGAMEPTNQTASDLLGRTDETTFNGGTFPITGSSSHLGLRFSSVGRRADGSPARLSAVVIHYESGDDED